MWCHDRSRQHRLSRVILGLAVLTVPLAYSGSMAAAETSPPTLKISGRAAFETEARAITDGFEVRALVTDDAGRPLIGAEVRLRAEGNGLPTLRRCGDARAESVGELIVTADGSGRVCVSVTGIASGAVTLSYQDTRGYFERATRTLQLPGSISSSFEVGFDPPLSTLSLDKPVQELGVLARSRNGTAAPSGAELSLSLTAGERELALGRSALEGLGEAQRFAVVSKSFGAPGPARLVARLLARSGEELGRASAAVLCTATVILELATDPARGTQAGSVLEVRAVSALGPAPSGVIEARSGGLSVAAAPVQNGVAHLTLPSAPAALLGRSVVLEYVGEGRGWLGGAPLEIAVMPPGPSYARYALWFGAAALAALAVVLGWRRPPRPRPAASTLPPRPRASVEVLEAFAGGAGYRGTVRDAHEGTPISPAVLSFIGPGSHGPVLQQARVGVGGTFDLEGAAFPVGTVVEVTAPFHTTLRAPLPPPGVLELSLISRRRAMLERLVRWAEQHGKPWTRSAGEPTPAHVVAAAANEAEPQVERWARGLEQLAFGPTPPDAASEIAAGVAEDPKLGRE
jgi:hypothetical protein